MNTKVQKTLIYKLSIHLFIILGLVSCLVIRSDLRDESNDDISTSSPKIIFLNYSARLNRPDGEIEIFLISKYITEGRLKINRPEPEISKPGDLKCITMNSRMEPIDSIIIADPFFVSVESADDRNALFRKEVRHDSMQFSVRIQLSDQTYAVAIKKNMDSSDQESCLLLTRIKEQ